MKGKRVEGGIKMADNVKIIIHQLEKP